MKKLIVTLAALLSSFSLIFGMTACNNGNVQNSEEKDKIASQSPAQTEPEPEPEPVEKDEPQPEPEPQPQPQPPVDPDPWYPCVPVKKSEYFSDFEEFKNYYETEFIKTNSEKFYLLYPEMESANGGFPSTFSIEGDNETFIYEEKDVPFVNPKVSEMFFIYSEELGAPPFDGMMTGLPAMSLDLEITFTNLPENYVKDKNYSFEFSDYTGKFKWHHTVKIFENGVLIAECHYDQLVNVPYEWLEDYFRKNLI